MGDLDILEVTDTSIGTLYLGRREVAGVAGWIYEILLGSDVLMTSLAPVSERALATSALAQHEATRPLRVLVGGLGLGYTAQAALADPRVASVEVIEKMDFVIDWMRGGSLPLSREFAAESRLQIVQGDVYEKLLGPVSDRYDLILVDVDHAPDDPLSDDSRPFYTTEGQQRVAQHLRPGGVLGVWSAVGDNAFATVLATTYAASSCEDIFWEDLEFPEADYQNVLFFATTPASGETRNNT